MIRKNLTKKAPTGIGYCDLLAIFIADATVTRRPYWNIVYPDGSQITSEDCSLQEVESSKIQPCDDDKRTMRDRLLDEMRKRNHSSQGNRKGCLLNQGCSLGGGSEMNALQSGKKNIQKFLSIQKLRLFLACLFLKIAARLLRSKNVRILSYGCNFRLTS